MTAARPVRNVFVDGPRSVGAVARRRRWQTLAEQFPDFAEMSVIDLGGTVEHWLRAPVKPRRVHLVNLEPANEQDLPSWIRHDIADATEIPAALLDPAYDLVYSNSVIEHVGGHQRRLAFVQQVNELAPRHWIQTPYRYFPLEPHTVCPFLQFAPLAVRAWLLRRWPLVHTRSTNHRDSVATALRVELLDITAMRHYFPDSTLRFDRMFGLVKSIVAVKGP